jgi:hypothetical protein
VALQEVSDHGFLPATDRTCPADAEPVIPPPDGLLAERLVEVATRSAALLQATPKFESYEEITNYYRSQLWEGDLMITPLQLDVPKYFDAFQAYHGEVLRVLYPAFEKMSSPGAWILEMARKHTLAKHSLQHVLFQMFLDQRIRREPPFGTGPWPCPNPVAVHGAGALTITTVREQREVYGLVGAFECGCGYVYTMSRRTDGRICGPRYRCFGPLLDIALPKLVEEGATLRGAATALGIHPRAVAAAAERLGLGKKWKVPFKAGRRLGKAIPDAPKDRHVAEPQKSRRPSAVRVNWESVDNETLESVRGIVERLGQISPPIMVSMREIERRHKRQSWIYQRRGKLPLTMQFLEGALETTEQFQERRARDIIRRAIEAGEFITPSKIVRAARLKSEQWTARVRIMIEEYPRRFG